MKRLILLLIFMICLMASPSFAVEEPPITRHTAWESHPVYGVLFIFQDGSDILRCGHPVQYQEKVEVCHDKVGMEIVCPPFTVTNDGIILITQDNNMYIIDLFPTGCSLNHLEYEGTVGKTYKGNR